MRHGKLAFGKTFKRTVLVLFATLGLFLSNAGVANAYTDHYCAASIQQTTYRDYGSTGEPLTVYNTSSASTYYYRYYANYAWRWSGGIGPMGSRYIKDLVATQPFSSGLKVYAYRYSNYTSLVSVCTLVNH